ncbi:glycosyltransferase family 39 protein [Paraconexibacter algicola]|nr:glycosyltransferase family 39 protein [Paraconexibacter algicola]
MPSRPDARTERLVFGALAVAALVAALLVPTYPNYDSYYALVWGRELADGVLPSFEAYAAPTQHPLWNLVGLVLGVLFGDDADRAVVVLAAVSHVLLCWAVYRLGTAVANRPVGAVAAALVGSSFAFLLFAARGYVDVPFLALVLWAAALEARRPRATPRPPGGERTFTAPPGAGDGQPGAGLPMLLLVLAGLLRPEAWVLAGLLWLWHGPAARVRAALAAGTPWRAAVGPRDALARPGLLAGVLVAPVLWALSDLAVTGDPLFSLNSTSALAEALGRDRGIAAVPRAFVSFLSDTARPPVAAAALGGIALCLLAARPLGLRALHVLAALFGAGAITFVGVGVAGLSILPRYLTVPVVALCLFAAIALAGWTLLDAGHARRALWRGGAIAGAVLGVLAVAVVKADAPGRFATELRYLRAVHDDLEAVLAVPAVQDGLRCGPVTLPNYRLVPDTRWVLDVGEADVIARSDDRRRAAGLLPSTGVALVAVGEKNVRRIGRADGTPRTTNRLPDGFREVARNRTFVAGVSC